MCLLTTFEDQFSKQYTIGHPPPRLSPPSLPGGATQDAALATSGDSSALLCAKFLPPIQTFVPFLCAVLRHVSNRYQLHCLVCPAATVMGSRALSLSLYNAFKLMRHKGADALRSFTCADCTVCSQFFFLKAGFFPPRLCGQNGFVAMTRKLPPTPSLPPTLLPLPLASPPSPSRMRRCQLHR